MQGRRRIQSGTAMLRRHAPSVTLLVVLFITLIAHVATLRRSPTVWYDEVLVVNYGRNLADPSTEYSMMLDKQGRPALPPYPLYAMVQYQWLRWTGTGCFAVRMLSSLCAVGAILMFWRLLRVHGVGQWYCTVFALALWADPLLVRSFRGGRADGFTFLLCFAACWMWWKALQRDSIIASVAAGSGAALAMLSWGTAPVTLALGVYIYCTAAWRERRACVRCVALAIAGAALVLATDWLYFNDLLDRMFSGSPAVPQYGRERSLAQIATTICGCYARSPWVLVLLILAIGVAVWTRQSLGLLLVVATSLLIATQVAPFYTWRVAYVVPLAYLFMARALEPMGMTRVLAVLLVVPSLAVNVGTRTAVTIVEWERRDYEAYAQQLVTLIPPNAVVVGESSHYYVGLREGWKMMGSVYFDRVKRKPDSFYLIVEGGHDVRWWIDAFDYRCIGEAKVPGRRTTAGVAVSYTARVYRCRAKRSRVTETTDRNAIELLVDKSGTQLPAPPRSEAMGRSGRQGRIAGRHVVSVSPSRQ